MLSVSKVYRVYTELKSADVPSSDISSKIHVWYASLAIISSGMVSPFIWSTLALSLADSDPRVADVNAAVTLPSQNNETLL